VRKVPSQEEKAAIEKVKSVCVIYNEKYDDKYVNDLKSGYSYTSYDVLNGVRGVITSLGLVVVDKNSSVCDAILEINAFFVPLAKTYPVFNPQGRFQWKFLKSYTGAKVTGNIRFILSGGNIVYSVDFTETKQPPWKTSEYNAPGGAPFSHAIIRSANFISLLYDMVTTLWGKEKAISAFVDAHMKQWGADGSYNSFNRWDMVLFFDATKDEALPRIIPYISVENPEIRKEAVFLLGEIGSKNTRTVLNDMLPREQNVEVFDEIENAIRNIDEPKLRYSKHADQ